MGGFLGYGKSVSCSWCWHAYLLRLYLAFMFYVLFCICFMIHNVYKIFFFPLGYHCEYKMRTGRKPDGCAICFKHSKFSLLSVNPVEFYRRDVPLLDRDNVGLVLLLQPKIPSAASPAICVANTHLLYNPRRGDIIKMCYHLSMSLTSSRYVFLSWAWTTFHKIFKYLPLLWSILYWYISFLATLGYFTLFYKNKDFLLL